MTTAKQDNDFRDMLLGSDALDQSIEWIKDNLEPDDVFDSEQLEDWAKAHGFVSTDDQ